MHFHCSHHDESFVSYEMQYANEMKSGETIPVP